LLKEPGIQIFITEAAFHNQAESEITITEKQSRMLEPIFGELNKIIASIEQTGLA
jgi:hypothetical protein